MDLALLMCNAIYVICQALVEAGCFVTVRSSKGDDQMAACGQLGEAVFAKTVQGMAAR